jgi:hypothetical protein
VTAVIDGAPKVDHVALEVGDVDAHLTALLATGAFKLLREGTRVTTGHRIFMLGDGTGFKIELIEAPAVSTPTFAHVALRVADVDQAHAALVEHGWDHVRGPNELPPAGARTALTSRDGFDLQVIAYASDSPDMVTWSE